MEKPDALVEETVRKWLRRPSRKPRRLVTARGAAFVAVALALAGCAVRPLGDKAACEVKGGIWETPEIGKQTCVVIEDDGIIAQSVVTRQSLLTG